MRLRGGGDCEDGAWNDGFLNKIGNAAARAALAKQNVRGEESCVDETAAMAAATQRAMETAAALATAHAALKQAKTAASIIAAATAAARRNAKVKSS